MKIKHIWLFSMLAAVAFSCTEPKKETLYRLLPPDETGVHFSNTIVDNDTFNAIDFTFIYNGAGVAVGDVNSDGLPDLYFSGNMVSSKLYLNKGDLTFEDITENSGAGTSRWATGVSITDINQDGLPDIYVCAANHIDSTQAANLLFVNQGNNSEGIPTFREMAESYGLADKGYSTQAAFLDYDRDGDLDMYLLTNAIEDFNHNIIRPKKKDGTGRSNDRLYRNEGTGPNGHPVFANVTREAGILIEGYGLGIAVSDLNQDGWPDIYCGNDFISNDLVWVNQGEKDGVHQGFVNMAADLLKHQTHNGMGTDIADFNNDGLVDIMVLDMLPEDNYRKKTMLGKPNYDQFIMGLSMEYQPQYVRNTLQLNQGLDASGKPVFSEIGQLAGVHQTDWSWACLLADYDNDGLRDLYITNGYRKDVTDLDFVVYQNNTMFGTAKSRDKAAKDRFVAVPEIKISNYMYRNSGENLRFEDVTSDWGLKQPSYSNGAIFADLDNDGDLDLAVNNIDEPAMLYENRLNRPDTPAQSWLRIKLKGKQGNLQGIGANIRVKNGDTEQFHYHSLSRGYKSSVDPVVHFGLGKAAQAETLQVTWPDGREQVLTAVPANQVLELRYADATAPKKESTNETGKNRLFASANQQMAIDYIHREEDYADFKVQPLIPHKHSQNGPGLAAGDINGDGLDDFYVGAGVGFTGRFFMQQANGTFVQRPLQGACERCEDTGALLFDADQDGDLDLYLASGSTEFYKGAENYTDRLYLNNGQGDFTHAPDALPPHRESSFAVKAADFDTDGDLDLFVGSRVVPGSYPLPPKSFIYRNDGGRFTDVTETVAPGLSETGMVSDALWTDFNNDGQTDLVMVGEFMAPVFYRNNGGSFTDVSAETGLGEYYGWWNSLAAGDFDSDGDIDYVAGNLGLNSLYKASPGQPLCIYAKDYDLSGSVDPLMCRYIKGRDGQVRNYISHTRDLLVDQVSAFRGLYPRYADYAAASFDEALSSKDLEGAYVVKSTHFASSWFENLGNGKFTLHELPVEAQFAPLFGMQAGDFNHDGHLDLLAAGNSYSADVQAGWYDAFNGLLLAGNGQGGFGSVLPGSCGFMVSEDAKAVNTLKSADGRQLVLVSTNRGPLHVFAPVNAGNERLISLQLMDATAEITLADGRTMKKEFYYGDTYLSQSARWLAVPAGATAVRVKTFGGQERSLSLNDMAGK